MSDTSDVALEHRSIFGTRPSSDTTEAQELLWVWCVLYLNQTGFIGRAPCVKPYPAVLPGGQTEVLQGPGSWVLGPAGFGSKLQPLQQRPGG